MLNSKLCDLLETRYPLIQGGMAWVSDASLATAVSKAGGLGVISAMNADAEYLRGEIKKLRSETDKPFAVNIMLMSPHVVECAKVVAEEHVPIVITGAGTPTPYMKDWIDAGIKVIPVVAAVAQAKMVERAGAVAVVAEGCESGGHVGESTTMSLVPQVCDAVSIPVIAAGGIADGRGVAAALMLGASGVQCGTCFLVADECTISDEYKRKIISARDRDTIVTGRRLGHPVRSLKNRFSRTFGEMEYDSELTNDEIEAFGAGALRKAAREGDGENGCFMSGQIAGLVKTRRPAAEIIETMLSETEELLNGAMKWVK